MWKNVIFGVAWWNERARANARAPKKLSDSKWLMFVDHFYFLNHACNSKSRRYNASWRSIQNENSAFARARSFHQATPKMTFFHIFKACSNMSWNFCLRKCARAHSGRQSMRMQKLNIFHIYIALIIWKLTFLWPCKVSRKSSKAAPPVFRSNHPWRLKGENAEFSFWIDLQLGLYRRLFELQAWFKK